ncbi:MAG: 2-oxoglutarate dehydrogenase complex dihydrolipoyllysine-residue succinyltransferase [Bacillota bacterium]
MIEVKVPELAESITEGTILEWLINVGEKVNKGESVVELETDKVNIEVNTDFTGVVTQLLKEPGDTVEVGDVIAILTEHVSDTATSPVPAVVPEEPVVEVVNQQEGIDLNQVSSSDPIGRIRPNDVKAQSQIPVPKEETKVEKARPNPGSIQVESVPNKPVEHVKMSRRRQTIAKRLVEVQHTAAMLTTFNEVDMTEVMNLRKKRKDAFFEKHDVRLGFMSFFTKAVVAALKQFPLLNAEIQGDELIVKKFYDIGIAVAAPEGLVVPVVRDANQKSFAEIEREISNLGKKARDNTLSLKELQGGTFTITNGGVFGSLMSTPILNSPQVGILGMHKIQTRPVAIDEERMENRPMMYIALSYDHRIVDGKEAVSFLASVKEMLEDPESLLLEG